MEEGCADGRWQGKERDEDELSSGCTQGTHEEQEAFPRPHLQSHHAHLRS